MKTMSREEMWQKTVADMQGEIHALQKTVVRLQEQLSKLQDETTPIYSSSELKNIEAEGIEANEILCKFSKKFLKKNKLFNVNLNEFENEILKTKKSCVSLIGVLEHLTEPHKVFRAFKKSKAEYLFISVPLASFTILAF